MRAELQRFPGEVKFSSGYSSETRNLPPLPYVVAPRAIRRAAEGGSRRGALAVGGTSGRRWAGSDLSRAGWATGGRAAPISTNRLRASSIIALSMIDDADASKL